MTATETEWISVAKCYPPDGVEVMTKIDDQDGVRNEQTLLKYGNLWFFPDRSMYVYYRPTHWRHIQANNVG